MDLSIATFFRVMIRRQNVYLDTPSEQASHYNWPKPYLPALVGVVPLSLHPYIIVRSLAFVHRIEEGEDLYDRGIKIFEQLRSLYSTPSTYGGYVKLLNIQTTMPSAEYDSTVGRYFAPLIERQIHPYIYAKYDYYHWRSCLEAGLDEKLIVEIEHNFWGLLYKLLRNWASTSIWLGFIFRTVPLQVVQRISIVRALKIEYWYDKADESTGVECERCHRYNHHWHPPKTWFSCSYDDPSAPDFVKNMHTIFNRSKYKCVRCSVPTIKLYVVDETLPEVTGELLEEFTSNDMGYLFLR